MLTIDADRFDAGASIGYDSRRAADVSERKRDKMEL